MPVNDPIADLLTRIRNAARNHAKNVKCLNSKVCRGVCDVLRDEGYIEGYDVIDDGRQGMIRVRLRYGDRGESIIRTIKRASKPGCRVYSKVRELPRPRQGLGVCVVSTSQGVKSDRKCREERIGGELLAIVD